MTTLLSTAHSDNNRIVEDYKARRQVELQAEIELAQRRDGEHYKNIVIVKELENQAGPASNDAVVLEPQLLPVAEHMKETKG